MDTLILFYLMIICGIATYSDLKCGIIRNKMLVGFGSIPVILNWISVFSSSDSEFYLINVVITIFLACLLYLLDIWAGGDCKLMIIIALTFPCSKYWELEGINYTLWLVYVLVFLFGILFIFCDNMNCLIKGKDFVDINHIIREIKSGIKKCIMIIVYIAFLGQFFLLVKQFIQLPETAYIMICIGLVLFVSRNRFLNKNGAIFSVAVIDAILFLITGQITINTRWHVYVIILMVIILKTISNRFNYDTIQTKDIKAGMILSYETSIILQKSRVRGLPGVSDESLKSRLKEDEVQAIKRWETSKYGKSELRVVKKIPFAIFITLGLFSYCLLGSELF